jgi:hypothetical protein
MIEDKIDNAVLLQVDATIIVGALIFLTFRSILRGETGEKLGEAFTLGSTGIIIILLGISVYYLLFWPAMSFGASKGLTVAAIFFLLVLVFSRSRNLMNHLSESKRKGASK